MRINPDAWSSAQSVAKAFIREHYAHELDIFGQVADIIKQRLITLNWSFELDRESDAGALGFGGKSLDTASAMISLAVPILMSELPISERPNSQRIDDVVFQVAEFCGAPFQFAEQLRQLAQTIYGLEFRQDAQQPYTAQESWEKFTKEGCQIIAIQEGIELFSRAKSDDALDILIQRKSGMPSIIYVRKTANGILEEVELSDSETDFLITVLQAGQPLPYDVIAETLWQESKNFSWNRLQKLKSRVCKGIGVRIGERITAPAKGSYQADSEIRFLILRRAFQTKGPALADARK